MQPKIITRQQAEAIYVAMCALNAIGALLNTNVDRVDEHNFTFVTQDRVNGNVYIRRVRDLLVQHRETYADQSAFAEAYDLKRNF